MLIVILATAVLTMLCGLDRVAAMLIYLIQLIVVCEIILDALQ